MKRPPSILRPNPAASYSWHLSKNLGFDHAGHIPMSLIYLLFFSKEKSRKDRRIVHCFTRVFCLFLSGRYVLFLIPAQQKLLFLVYRTLFGVQTCHRLSHLYLMPPSVGS